MTLSPTLSSIGITSPLSVLRPGPTAMITPSCGFSLAVSGRMTPPVLVDACSMDSTTTRSPSGLSSVLDAVAGTGTHPPYDVVRYSRLTRDLKVALHAPKRGDDARTRMVALAPARDPEGLAPRGLSAKLAVLALECQFDYTGRFRA